MVEAKGGSGSEAGMTEEEEEDTALLLLVVALLQLVMPDPVPASPFGLELDYLIMHYMRR